MTFNQLVNVSKSKNIYELFHDYSDIINRK